jgi:hypothetical protein
MTATWWPPQSAPARVSSLPSTYETFPEAGLARHGVVAMHLDVFALELLARHPAAILEVVAMQAADLKSPSHTAMDGVIAVERSGPALVRQRERAACSRDDAREATARRVHDYASCRQGRRPREAAMLDS